MGITQEFEKLCSFFKSILPIKLILKKKKLKLLNNASSFQLPRLKSIAI